MALNGGRWGGCDFKVFFKRVGTLNWRLAVQGVLFMHAQGKRWYGC